MSYWLPVWKTTFDSALSRTPLSLIQRCPRQRSAFILLSWTVLCQRKSRISLQIRKSLQIVLSCDGEGHKKWNYPDRLGKYISWHCNFNKRFSKYCVCAPCSILTRSDRVDPLDALAPRRRQLEWSPPPALAEIWRRIVVFGYFATIRVGLIQGHKFEDTLYSVHTLCWLSGYTVKVILKGATWKTEH